MICVLSQSILEDTTEAVMDWLGSWGAPCVRINGDDIDSPGCPSFSVGSEGVRARIKIDGEEIDPDKVKVVWYRRWAFHNTHLGTNVFADAANATTDNLHTVCLHLTGELRSVSSLLFSTFSGAEWLGRPATSAPNKFRILKAAADAGLDIPDTLVTANLDDLREFIKKHGAVVVKAASDCFTCNFDGQAFAVYTTEVSEPIDSALWKGSFPSLFQEKLDKKYEIRIFYLDGRFYSMAMLTQQKASTRVDFRRYSLRDPVRTVPYKLPEEIERKLAMVMKEADLETGSIDMVRTSDGRFVFLEVNPVGQFGMVSVPCNYYLERKVARALMERLYERQKEP